jgi:type I restriction enzyme S subunit
MRPTAKIHGQFAVYQILNREFIDIIDGSTFGAKMPRVSWEFMANMPCPTPPIPEQQTIATFLDCETAKIDALVAEQENLIALLKEKRQAVISHAVTKGLDPTVPMKDSGIEWLGEVPAHWQIKKLKHVKANTQNAFVDGPFGSNLKSEHFIEDGDVYVIESNFATQGRLDFPHLKTINQNHFETIKRSEVMTGDIVLAKIGAQFGKASILPMIDRPAVVSGNSMKLSVNPDICCTHWAYWQLYNLKNNGEIDLLVNGSAQPALSLGAMNELVTLLPPLSEQSEIVGFLDTRTTKLDDLTAEAQRTIDLLKERRSALISAAVTGKIDVWGYHVHSQPIR